MSKVYTLEKKYKGLIFTAHLLSHVGLLTGSYFLDNTWVSLGTLAIELILIYRQKDCKRDL